MHASCWAVVIYSQWATQVYWSLHQIINNGDMSVVCIYILCYWPWLYIGHGYIVLEHSTHLVWTRRSSHDAADVIVLWITYSVNIDRQAGPCIQTLLVDVFSN